MPSPNTADIRAWAQQNGHPVGDRGRLPAEVLTAYDKANRKSKPSVRPASKATPSVRPASKAAPPAAKIAPVVVTTTTAPFATKEPTAAPVVAKAPESDRLAARLVDVELRLSELTRRLTALEASASPRRFGRRRT